MNMVMKLVHLISVSYDLNLSIDLIYLKKRKEKKKPLNNKKNKKKEQCPRLTRNQPNIQEMSLEIYWKIKKKVFTVGEG